MSDAPDDPLKDHDFDGIQEYDNQLPQWLMMMFYLAIAWSLWYYGYYHLGLFGDGRLGADRLAQENALVAERVRKLDSGPADEATLIAESTKEDRIEAGAQVWSKSDCATCHRPEAWGDIGPNLRDDYWIYPITFQEMVKTIARGRAGNQMPAHDKELTRREIQNLVFYLVDLNRHSEKNPDGTSVNKDAKPPEGERSTFPHLATTQEQAPEAAVPAE